ncbi:hybrid sensor histidine kinase/response regulator [Nereida ignava]|uniref:hybrid sensor histidine kinase/response regulator n=1 Tax=Nereida ignava TaxID=282199 RepID=UPI0023B5BB0C
MSSLPLSVATKLFRWAFGTISIAIIVGCIAISYLSYSVWTYVDNLGVAKQGQQEYMAAQLEIEYLKLQDAVDDALAGGPEDIEDVRKRFDIFYSRTLPLRFGSQAGQFNADLLKLQAVLDAQVPLIDGTDAQLFGQLDQLAETLETVRPLPRKIGLDFVSHEAKAGQREREKIINLIEILIISVSSMIIVFIAMIVGLLRQAKTLNTTTQLAEERDQRLSATLRGSLDGVVVTDENAIIIDFSQSAEDVFGFTRDQAIGQSFFDLLLPAEESKMFYAAMANYRQTGKTTFAEKGRQELNMMHQDGHAFPAEMTASIAHAGSHAFFICYVRNITDQKAQKAELISSRDDALSANRERSRFFAMMSHEMRTPLNGVPSALQMLEGSELNCKQRSYVGAALTSGDILMGHINDVLAVESAEKRKNPEPTPCDIAALTNSLVATLQPLARDNQTAIELVQPEAGQQFFLTDQRAIQQIIVNLLSNAIKFTPSGSVKLETSYSKENGTLIFDVTDTGIGIAEDDVKRIFDDFVSLDSSYERRTNGTGLGLGIVQRFVTNLGGEITCKSTLGVGTHFQVILPMQEAAPATTNNAQQTTSYESSKNRQSLLVVDDNEINRDLLGAMLERLGHKVCYATGGQQAVNISLEHRFDAILMDISMPGVSGTQATQRIRASRGPNQNTHIIAVTAHALPQERTAFTDAGMTGFLAKPINLKELDACLLGAGKDQHSASESLPHTSDSLVDVAQVNELIAMLGHDTFMDRLDLLKTQFKTQIDEIQATQDLAGIETYAHSMAGSCGMLGAKHLHSVLQDIETACKTGNAQDALGLVKQLESIAADTFDAWNNTLGQSPKVAT